MPHAAATLRALHVPGDPLVLANIWDAGTARLVERAGFPAVATTSAGVAEALGYADGEQTPVEEMLAAVARIARAVEVPVTADMEGGYGLEPAEIGRRVAATGAAGLNQATIGRFVELGAQVNVLLRPGAPPIDRPA